MSGGRYAQSTDVSSDRSRSQIEQTLTRYGARQFSYGWDDGPHGMVAVIQFVQDGLMIRFRLAFPSRDDREFTLSPTGRQRTDTAAAAAYEQAIRQKWRALLLVVKAKLEAVEAGITSFEQEFMPHVVLPGGRTVSDELLPQVHAVLRGEQPRLLIEGGPR